jgi:hypothetical protein
LAHLLMHRTFIVMSPKWKGWPVRAFAVMRPLLWVCREQLALLGRVGRLGQAHLRHHHLRDVDERLQVVARTGHCRAVMVPSR